MKFKIIFSLFIAFIMILIPKQVVAEGRISLSQTAVYPAEVFNIYYYDFEPDISSIRFISQQMAEVNFSVVDQTSGHISLKINDVRSFENNNDFIVSIKDKQSNAHYQTETLTVLGRQKLPLTILKFGVLARCGNGGNEGSRPVESSGYLFKESDKSTPLEGHVTSTQNGYIFITYSSTNIKAGDTFIIEQNPIDGISATPTNNNFRFTIPDPLPDVWNNAGTATFLYPTCTSGMFANKNNPQPTPTATPSPLTKYKCSGSFCVTDPDGTYTSNDCNNACSAFTSTITVKASVQCGAFDKIMKESTTIQMTKEDGSVLDSQSIAGFGTLEYTDKSIIPGQEFILKAQEFPDIFPANIFITVNGIYKGANSIIIPNPVPLETYVSALISYPYCPGNAIQNSTPTPTETPTASPQQAELTQVIISNYADFRANDSGDVGSFTTAINNPNQSQRLDWTLATNVRDKYFYVREIYSDGSYKDYWNTVTHHGQLTYIANIEIQSSILKKATRINIADQEFNLEDPYFFLHLPGIERQSQQFQIPVVITYSDGQTLHTALTFNYNPVVQPSSLPTSNSTPSGGGGTGGDCNLVNNYNECGSNGGCYGTEQEGILYKVEQYQGNTCSQDYVCKEIENCSSKGQKCENGQCVGGSSGGGNTCTPRENFNCTGDNAGCGDGSGEMKKTTVNADCSETSITYCDSACANGQ